MPIKQNLKLETLKWLDVTAPTSAEMEQLSREYSLNQHTVVDCLQPEHLPKYEYDDEVQVHFLILRYYSYDSDTSANSIQNLTNKIAIFYNDKIVITIHSTETSCLELVAKRAAKQCSSTTELLSKIVWQALETFDDPAARLSEQLDFYENRVRQREVDNNLTEALFNLKRQTSISNKVLMLMQEPINHIRVKPGEEMLLQDVKDQHLKMQTLYGQSLEDVNNLLNLTTAFSAQRTNEVMRVLTIFSVFFMPLTFIVGIYGMNFEFMPELKQRWGYPIVMILMGVVTLIIYQWFKRKKWL